MFGVMAQELEYGNFDGTPEELADFVDRTWQSAYEGQFWYPRWSADFFRWQLAVHGRALMPAARAGGRLVGCFPAMPLRMRLRGVETGGALVSWCTADPAYRSHRLALRLTERLRTQCLELGITVAIGVVSGDKNSVARRFWWRYTQLYPERARFSRLFRWWVKILDPSAVVRGAPDAWERVGIRSVNRVVHRTPFPALKLARPFVSADLDEALRLVSASGSGLDWAPLWTKAQLSQQLLSPVSSTLLVERRGAIEGLVNWHLLTLQGRQPICAAVIDIWATTGLGMLDEIGLLGAACVRLSKLNVDIVLALGCGTVPKGALLANLFVPRPTREDHLAVLFAKNARNEGLADAPPYRCGLPFR
jgi:GNAT superfamily N-acetyltransferase